MMRRPRGTRVTLCVAGVLACPATFAQEDVEQFDSGGERVPLLTVVPVYPAAARRDRVEGEVQVCFEVTRGGMPRRIAVRKSTYREFEKPSRDAVRRSRWVPLAEGEPLPAIKTCRTFRYSLVPVEETADQS